MTEIALIGNPNSGKTSYLTLLQEPTSELGTGLVLRLKEKVEYPKRIKVFKFRICLGSIPCPLIVLKKKWRGIIS